MLKGILKEYEVVAGQCVNYEKSINFFSTNTSGQVRSSMMQFLNFRISTNPKKYLGLPNMVDWGKKLAFQLLKDRMR